jgi:hypothetical protein
MKYSTFKRLAEELRPFIIKASGQKDVHALVFHQMDEFHPMSDLHVTFVGLLVVLHTML